MVAVVIFCLMVIGLCVYTINDIVSEKKKQDDDTFRKLYMYDVYAMQQKLLIKQQRERHVERHNRKLQEESVKVLRQLTKDGDYSYPISPRRKFIDIKV